MSNKALFHWFLGSPKRFSLKQRIFNGGAFASMLICLLITAGDTIHDIGNVSTYITLIPALCFASLFWYGKARGANKTLFVLFFITGLGGVLYDWALFYGFSGSSLLISMIIAALIPTFFNGKSRFIAIAITFAFLSALFILEYNGIFNPGDYPTKQDRIADLFMTASFMIIGMLILVSVIIESYDQQKQLTQKLNAQLARHNKNLKHDIELKDKFFAIISHDLRGPVGALNGLSNILEEETIEDVNTSETTHTIVNSMKVSSKQALQLLDNLLNWARAESGDLKPELQDEIIENVLDDNITLFQSNIKIKNLIVNSNYKAIHKAVVDKSMLDLIIRNLLSNAIKFTPNDGNISIETGEQGGRVFFSVSDNGVGIDENALKHLFQIDQRGSTDGTNSEKGTGLGLKLCSQFVKLIDGEITAKSKIGDGTSFKVFLKKGAVKESLN